MTADGSGQGFERGAEGPDAPPRRVLVTDAGSFLGPAVVERLRRRGDHVTALEDPLASFDSAAAIVEAAGPLGVLVANLDAPITVASIVDHDDAAASDPFDRLVQPLFWLLRACLPSMIAARGGAIVVPTSATAIRSSSLPIAAYESTRAAQTTLVRSVAQEVARHDVRVNAVAPNFIENPSYFPPETVADPEFQRSMRRVVPAQRLGTGDEAAAVVEWLASPEASYLFGAVVPVDGGWTLGG